MTPLNQHDLTLLQILNSEAIYRKAVKTLNADVVLFPSAQVPHLYCIWITYLQCCYEAKKAGKKVDKDEVIARVLTNAPKYNMLPENKAKLKTILERYKEGEEVNLELANQNLLTLVKESIQSKVARAVINSEAYESIKALVEKGTAVTAALDQLDKPKELYTNPLMNASKYLKKIPKRPTGVVHFDTVTHGGMAPGEVCLIAGVYGGGKSMTTNQLVGTQLLLGQYVGWFTYEQPFDQDLMQRLVSFVTGYSLDQIRQHEFEELPAAVQEKYNRLAETMQDKLIAADFSDVHMLDKDDEYDDGSVYSIRKRLQLAKDKGIQLNYLVIDWLGAAVRKIAAVKGVDIGSVTNYKAIADDYMNDLVVVAKEFNIPIIIFHQLIPDIKKSPPSRKPASTELQMIHTVGNWVQYAITIGKQDDNHRCWFICDKNRTGLPSECVIELDGDRARFIMLHGYAPGRNGQFVDMADIEQEQQGDDYGKDVDFSYGMS